MIIFVNTLNGEIQSKLRYFIINCFSKKLFRKNRNAKILPSSGQNNASDKLTVSSKAAVTTAGGVVLTGVTTYASSYVRKTGMDPRDPIFTLDVRTGNSRQVYKTSFLAWKNNFYGKHKM